jgi:hypothetical protein
MGTLQSVFLLKQAEISARIFQNLKENRDSTVRAYQTLAIALLLYLNFTHV